MPQVQTLKILGIDLPVHRKDIRPQNIREFGCILQSVDAFRFILSLRNLSTLHIGFKETTLSSDPFDGPIIFPHLEYLHVTAALPDKFWALLNAPKLETVFLDSLSIGRPYESERIIGTFPQLKRLDIYSLANSLPNRYLALDFATHSPKFAMFTYGQHNKEIMSSTLREFARRVSKLDHISVTRVMYDERSGKPLWEDEPVNIDTFLNG
jgi:hypothetical protein